MMDGRREWVVGSNTLRYEPPELLWFKFGERMTEQDAIRIMGIYRELREQLESRPFIFVAEMKKLDRFDPEAGRYLSEHLPSEWFLGKIFVGARLLHRAFVKGIALASLLTDHVDEHAVEKLHYVATPEQAHELIAQLRHRHRAA